MLRADNAEVLIHPSDRKYGALLIGGQGTGKTSARCSLSTSTTSRIADAAPIVIDPKSELSRICLRMTPPDCGKRVWFLDLGHPAFGMIAAAADRRPAAGDRGRADRRERRRRAAGHQREPDLPVLAPLPLPRRDRRDRDRPRKQDAAPGSRTSTRSCAPPRTSSAHAVAEACADQPDLDQTAEFFRSELPDDLRMATSRVAERLDAPRNKISGLTGVPPLRRFFNHPTDIPLREIIQARDILIVDANMAAIGTENSKACMLFILRMLHAQLQRQVHLPERERPRVPLIVDEAHYVAGGENVVDQIATHRAAGLEPAFGLQYFAQLGSASEHQQKILKGVLNLLQSRFLFRMGDAQDAEQATRIAMAVYSTMIRDDPDSRARLRVTPEQLAQLPQLLLPRVLDRATAPARPRFTGQTYPLPDIDDEWAEHHLAAQAERVGPYPEQLESTLDTHAPAAKPRATAASRLARVARAARASTSPCPTSRRTRPSDSERAGTQRAALVHPRRRRPRPFDRWRDPDRTPPRSRRPDRTNETRASQGTPADDSVEDTAQPTTSRPAASPT